MVQPSLGNFFFALFFCNKRGNTKMRSVRLCRIRVSVFNGHSFFRCLHKSLVFVFEAFREFWLTYRFLVTKVLHVSRFVFVSLISVVVWSVKGRFFQSSQERKLREPVWWHNTVRVRAQKKFQSCNPGPFSNSTQAKFNLRQRTCIFCEQKRIACAKSFCLSKSNHLEFHLFD